MVLVAFVTLMAGTPIVLSLAIFWTADKKKHGGLWWWQQRRIMKKGLRGTGLVLDAASLSTRMANRILFHRAEVVVEVEVEGRAPYRAQVRAEVPSSLWLNLRKDERVPVRVDPTNPAVVLFDIAAHYGLDDEGKAEAKAELDAQKARQAALMAGKDPD